MSEIFPPSPRPFRRRLRWPGALPVLGAALLWSTLGIFYRYLTTRTGMPPTAIAFARAAGGGLVLAAFLALRRREDLTIALRDLPGFALGGLASVSLFYVFFIEAVSRTTVATAVVLLYTAPAWVALISWIVWSEPLTRRRGTALLLAAAGTALVAGVADPASLRLEATGVAFGILSGLTYALYSIYGTWALGRYGFPTVVTWALLFGALFLLPIQEAGALAPLFRSPGAFATMAALIAGPTVGAYVLYTRGLQQTGASVASLLATVEPVSAALLAWLLLGEVPRPDQAAGGAFVIAALWVLSLRPVEPPGGRHASV